MYINKILDIYLVFIHPKFEYVQQSDETAQNTTALSACSTSKVLNITNNMLPTPTQKKAKN